jgi:hypothetical protein
MGEVRAQVAELFCAAVELRGYTARATGDGEVTVSGPAGTTIYHLENLMRKAAAAPRQDWPALAADHFGTGLAHDDADHAEPLTDREFPEIQTLIRTRLYPDDDVHEEVGCVCRPLAPGLAQRVVLDSVHTIAPVTEELLASWPLTERALFDLAETNTRADGPLDIARADFPDGAPPWFLLAGGDYTSAHALWLGDYPDLIGPAGALFTAPAELGIRVAPIHGMEILEAGNILATLGAHHFANDPYPISRHLYRWYDGRIELAAYVEPSDTTLALLPTDEFVSLLNQLAT